MECFSGNAVSGFANTTFGLQEIKNRILVIWFRHKQPSARELGLDLDRAVYGSVVVADPLCSMRLHLRNLYNGRFPYEGWWNGVGASHRTPCCRIDAS
jgi:hypothetical protein